MDDLRPQLMRRLCTLVGAVLLGVGLGACPVGDPTTARPPATASGVIDSALPLETLLHRFRATLPDTPTVLQGGAESPEALTRALLTALAADDTAAVRALAISRAEFAWLYYPHTKWTKPPYGMAPDLVWLQVSAASEKGFVRLVRRYGGSALRFERLTCADSAVREGPNLVTTGCRVRFAASDSTAREMQVFGSLLNRGGRYKFISYSNDL